jgi:hypothetical protein
MISTTSTLIHPGRPRLTSVSLATNEFDELYEDGFGLRFELGGELPEQEGKNTCAAEGKPDSGAFGEGFVGEQGKRWCCN